VRPAVSVVLCTFNRAATVSRAIRSALAQTHTDFELVIVDDGSTDDTAARVGAFVDPRIRHVRQANHGPSHARNTGIARARGRWIAFLDSDDEYRPRHLERRLRYVAAHRGVRVLHDGVELIGPLENHFALDVARTGLRIHLARCRLAGPLFVERRCLLAVGGFRELACSEDYDLIRRLEARFLTRRVRAATYVYHVDGDDRVSAFFAQSGEAGVLAYRRRGTARNARTSTEE
jgi:glycosyltransferase involved in cell wall biosynthesis